MEMDIIGDVPEVVVELAEVDEVNVVAEAAVVVVVEAPMATDIIEAAVAITLVTVGLQVVVHT